MGSYGALWSARIRLLRPGNATMAAIAVLAGGILATDHGWLRIADAWTAALAAFLVTGFGNVLNDIVDVDVDRRAHPNRPLPSGLLDVGQAKVFAAILLALGLWEAFVAAGWPTFLFASINGLALVAYERRFKRTGLPGNILVGLLVGSAFLFGATATGTDPSSWGMVVALAVMACLSNIARELLKDLQDLKADQGRRQTFPMQAGATATVGLATFLVLAAVALSGVAYQESTWTWRWGAMLAAADAVFLASLWLARSDVGRAQQGLKVAMLLALAAFLAGPVL